jgi:hypothetical protein
MVSPSLPAFTVRRGEPVLCWWCQRCRRRGRRSRCAVGHRRHGRHAVLLLGHPPLPRQPVQAGPGRGAVQGPRPYYPLAGRLREEAGRKLVVECGAQGSVFAEADADLAADDFGVIGSPPFPCFEQFVMESTATVSVPSRSSIAPCSIFRYCHGAL